jgi:hypothetical protein
MSASYIVQKIPVNFMNKVPSDSLKIYNLTSTVGSIDLIIKVRIFKCIIIPYYHYY